MSVQVIERTSREKRARAKETETERHRERNGSRQNIFWMDYFVPGLFCSGYFDGAILSLAILPVCQSRHKDMGNDSDNAK